MIAEIIKFVRSEEPTQSDQVKPSEEEENKESNIFINPVCGVPVEKLSAKHIIEYAGENYYFCCDGCKVSFEKEPEKYVNVAQS